MAKILITGIAGFIGSNLADALLAQGHEVAGLDDLSQGLRENVPAGTRFDQADITDPAIYPLFKGYDAVFHFAAKNCISDCQLDPVATVRQNVLGTVNVFEAARRSGVGKIIYAESSALYEGSAIYPTPESESAPHSFYALSKAAGRLFAEGYREYFGLRATALRYFCVYGPRQDYRRTVPPLMSAFALKLLRGEAPVIYGDGSKRRDFVYVDDINRFHLQCLTDARTDGQVYNLGSGKSHSVREIYTALEAQLHTGIQPQFAADLPGEAQTTWADISAARALGWQPEISLEEGLRRVIAYLRTHVIAAEARP